MGIGGVASLAGSAWFAMRMKGFDSETHELLVAQQFVAGAPAEEMTAPAFQED